MDWEINTSWQKLVEDFLYRNYIKFSTTIIPGAWMKPERVAFKFSSDIGPKEEGLIEGFFQGLKAASDRLK